VLVRAESTENSRSVTVDCSEAGEGWVATGGGAEIIAPPGQRNSFLVASYPLVSDDTEARPIGWYAERSLSDGQPQVRLAAYVLCAPG
jgi:hypothetical protein